MYILTKKYSRAILLVNILLVAQPGLADEWIKPGEETFTIGAGVFLPSFNSSLRVNNSSLDLGDQIDLEKDLGLDSRETVAWINGMWRFADNHRLSVTYFQFSRSSVVTALKDITIDEETFPAGVTLSTRFQYRTIPITYHYSFIKSAQHELAGSFGLQWNTIDIEVDGETFVGSGNNINGQAEAKSQAPLPLFGMSYAYHASKRWTTGFHAEILALDINDDTFSFSGTVTNVRASTEYWLYNNFGAGFAINWFSMDVDVDDSEWQGNFDYQYFGPQIYANLRF